MADGQHNSVPQLRHKLRTSRAALDAALRALHDQADAIVLMRPGSTDRAHGEGVAKLAHSRAVIASLGPEARAIAAIARAGACRIADLSIDRVIATGRDRFFSLFEETAMTNGNSTGDLHAPGIDRDSVILCPDCGTNMLEGAPKDWFYIADGDSVPDFAAEIASVPCFAFAGVGFCHKCGGRYWRLEVFVHPDGWEPVQDMMNERPPVIAWHDGGHADWQAFRTQDLRGIAFEVGPIAVHPETETHGSNGVSACRGGEFWRTAGEAFRDFQPTIEGILAQGRVA